MKIVVSACLIGVLCFSALLAAEEPALPTFHPTSISGGPVLFFKQPKHHSDELALYLFDPSIHEKPQVIWQDLYHPNPRAVKRLSSEVMLMEFQDQLHLVDLSTGGVTPLLPGVEQQELVAIEGQSIFFFQRTVPRTSKDIGMGLTTGEGGKTVVEEYFRPRDVLFHYKVGNDGRAKKVSSVIIEKLLEVGEEGFFVITAETPQKVAWMTRDGKLTGICPFDSRWVASVVTHSISPRRNYLALAVLGLDQDFHDERTLLVCDLKKNKVCFTDPDVPLGPCLFSGRSNFLELVWQEDELLKYSGPFSFVETSAKEGARFVNVEKRSRLDREAVSKLPAISFSEEPERKTLGRFELKFGEVYFPGEKTPVASVLDERGAGVRDLAIDGNGRWAAYSERKDDQIYLINGITRKKRALHTGWAHDLKWFEVDVKN